MILLAPRQLSPFIFPSNGTLTSLVSASWGRSKKVHSLSVSLVRAPCMFLSPPGGPSVPFPSPVPVASFYMERGLPRRRMGWENVVAFHLPACLPRPALSSVPSCSLCSPFVTRRRENIIVRRSHPTACPFFGRACPDDRYDVVTPYHPAAASVAAQPFDSFSIRL